MVNISEGASQKYRVEECPGIPEHVYVCIPADLVSKDELTSIAALCNAVSIEQKSGIIKILLRKKKAKLFISLLEKSASKSTK